MSEQATSYTAEPTANGRKVNRISLPKREIEFPIEIELSNGVIVSIDFTPTGEDMLEAQRRSGTDFSLVTTWLICLCCKFDGSKWRLDQVGELAASDVLALQSIVSMGKLPTTARPT